MEAVKKKGLFFFFLFLCFSTLNSRKPPSKSFFQMIIYRAVIKPLCEAIAQYVPAPIHPNLITLAGGFIAFAGMQLSAATHAKDATGNEPYWVIVCYLLYIVLDNLDGAHARSTGQSSKLGHFLDHFVDFLFGMGLYATSSHYIFFGSADWNNEQTAVFADINAGLMMGCALAHVLEGSYFPFLLLQLLRPAFVL